MSGATGADAAETRHGEGGEGGDAGEHCEGAGDAALRPASQLVPRFSGQGYGDEDLAARRHWVEERTGARLDHVGRHSLTGEEMRGNVENPIGAAQVPLGVAGPLAVQGEHARGTFYVPLALTEGAGGAPSERALIALTPP